MDSLNNTNGLQVVRTYPPMGMEEMSVYDKIEVEFSEDLDASTISKNIRLYQSVGGVFTSIGKLEDLTKFIPVELRASYKDRVVTLEPFNPLSVGKDFVLIVEAFTVSSITGKQLLQHSVTLFKTEVDASPRPVKLISPGLGAVLQFVNALAWSGDADSYVVQVAKESSFSSLIFDKPVQGTTISPDFLVNADEGIYFWRVKPEGGDFSSHSNFFIKPIESIPVSHEDAPERIVGLPWDNEMEVLEMFPEDGFSNVGLNLKSIYVKVSGLYTASDLALNMTYVTGVVNDENDIGTIEDHGDLKGSWTVVRDEDNNCTYLVFSIDKV